MQLYLKFNRKRNNKRIYYTFVLKVDILIHYYVEIGNLYPYFSYDVVIIIADFIIQVFTLCSMESHHLPYFLK